MSELEPWAAMSGHLALLDDVADLREQVGVGHAGDGQNVLAVQRLQRIGAGLDRVALVLDDQLDLVAAEHSAVHLEIKVEPFFEVAADGLVDAGARDEHADAHGALGRGGAGQVGTPGKATRQTGEARPGEQAKQFSTVQGKRPAVRLLHHHMGCLPSPGAHVNGSYRALGFWM
jgi:hypothetical protein